MFGGAGLVVLCLCLYLPGLLTLPPVDRDECRFAQASRQMLESGDWVLPRVQDKPRLNKPPLIYWLQACSAAVLGDDPGDWPNANIVVFRVPSVLCAIASVLMVWRFGLRVGGGMFDARAASLGAALLAASPMVVWDAHQARADQLLLATVVFTQLALWRVWSAASREKQKNTLGWAVLFWVGIGVGTLAKGPITPMIAGLTVLALCVTTRRWRWVRSLEPAVGLVLAVVIVAPWVMAVGERVGWREYLDTVYAETLGRAGRPPGGHWAPPGLHLVLLPVLMWPGSLLTALAARRAIGNAWGAFKGRVSARPAELFLICWALPAFVVFEIIPAKLPHYTMPLFPALCLLSARAVFRAASGRLKGQDELGSRVGYALWGLIGAAAFASVWVGGAIAGFGTKVMFAEVELFLTALAGMVAAVAIGIMLSRAHYVWPLLAVLFGVVPIAAYVLHAVLPRLVPGVLSADIGRVLERETRMWSESRLIATAYHEDSLVFWTRGSAELIDLQSAETFLDEHPEALLVLVGGSSGVNSPQGARRLVENFGAVGDWTFVVCESESRP